MQATRGQTQIRANLVGTVEAVRPGETVMSDVEKQLGGLAEAGVSVHTAARPERVTVASENDGLIIEHVVVGPTGQWVH